MGSRESQVNVIRVFKERLGKLRHGIVSQGKVRPKLSIIQVSGRPMCHLNF